MNNTQTTETLAQEAYRLLKDVPSDQWITDILADDNIGCASGWYMGKISGKDHPVSWFYVTHEVILRDRKLRILRPTGVDVSYVHVNNKKMGKYQQDTPKERVMAYLQDCINEGL